MRALAIGLLMFFTLTTPNVVDARGSRGKRPETKLIFSATVLMVPRSYTVPEAPSVELRWGKMYWPGDDFGHCFVELRTPQQIVRDERYWNGIEISWQGEVYVARCLNSSNFFGSDVYLSKVVKKPE